MTRRWTLRSRSSDPRSGPGPALWTRGSEPAAGRGTQGTRAAGRFLNSKKKRGFSYPLYKITLWVIYFPCLIKTYLQSSMCLNKINSITNHLLCIIPPFTSTPFPRLEATKWYDAITVEGHSTLCYIHINKNAREFHWKKNADFQIFENLYHLCMLLKLKLKLKLKTQNSFLHNSVPKNTVTCLMNKICTGMYRYMYTVPNISIETLCMKLINPGSTAVPRENRKSGITRYRTKAINQLTAFRNTRYLRKELAGLPAPHSHPASSGYQPAVRLGGGFSACAFEYGMITFKLTFTRLYNCTPLLDAYFKLTRQITVLHLNRHMAKKVKNRGRG